MLPIPHSTYRRLFERLKHSSSWAVWANPPVSLEGTWSKKEVGEAGFFEVSDAAEYRAGIGQALRNDVLLVALNSAERYDEDGALVSDSRPFAAFHDRSKSAQDYTLRALAFHFGLWGGLITDLDHWTVATDSGPVVARLKEDVEHRQRCADRLGETLALLQPTRDLLVVELGKHGFLRHPEFQDVLSNHAPDHRLVGITHYSHRGITRPERLREAATLLGGPHNTKGLYIP